MQSPALTPEQESFNAYLRGTQTVAEMLFGRVKSRWRILLKRSDFHFTFNPLMVVYVVHYMMFMSEREDLSLVWNEDMDDFEIANCTNLAHC